MIYGNIIWCIPTPDIKKPNKMKFETWNRKYGSKVIALVHGGPDEDRLTLMLEGGYLAHLETGEGVGPNEVRQAIIETRGGHGAILDAAFGWGLPCPPPPRPPRGLVLVAEQLKTTIDTFVGYSVQLALDAHGPDALCPKGPAAPVVKLKRVKKKATTKRAPRKKKRASA